MTEDAGVDALSAEYVLGTLDPAERLMLDARLSADPAVRAAVGSWAARLQPLSDALPGVAPPSDLFARIGARLDVPVDRVSAAIADVSRRAARRRRLVLRIAAAVGLLLAASVVVAFV